MKNFLRILYIIIFVISGIFVFTHPVKTETNILKAVFSDSSADEIIVKLSGRYSSTINVIAQSEDSAKASEIIDEFSNSLDKNSFEIQNFDSSKMIEDYQKHYKTLLSNKTSMKLERHNYDEVVNEAFGRLYDPFGFMLLPLNQDPFMLFTDYIQSLGDGDLNYINYNDKYYKILTLKVKNDTALSPDILNKKVKNLVDLQTNLSNDDVQIYLTGAPVHSYYASSKSMKEINIICILSSLFVIGLCYFYFRNLKLLIPIGISLGLGILSGYILTSIIFPSIHVLTFVFSTTLIGICIDYSLHYFIEKDLSKIFKSLTVSMLTTVSAFGVLLFSGVELLRQIAVFTMTGLFSVYSIVVLFYPLLNLEYKSKEINFTVCEKFKKVFAVIILLIAVGGMFFLKFDDNIKNMYVPSKKLLSAEQLFNNITGGNKKTSFAVVKGRDTQDMLQKEEWIARNLQGFKYQALSKFIPSKKQQMKNFELRKDLYKNSLEKYATFLSKNDIQNLLKESAPKDFIQYQQKSLFSDFLIADNTSVMVLYDFNRPEIITQNGGQYVDVQNDVSARIKECRLACLKMLLPVFILLFGILSVIYRPRTAAKILTPSILAGAFAIGLLSICQQEINLFHVLAIFLIIGFGLDYSVFRAGGVKNSSDAVLLSCATSVFSFILLAFTSFKLISSLGFVLSAGLIVSYLSSLFFNYGDDVK